ncbi:hypothetical protein OAF54_00945 [bacterium]|nr:hypothetical protein [bacterium]
MSNTAKTLRSYATQIDHNIAYYDVTGKYPDDPVSPEVVINLNKAADEIEHLRACKEFESNLQRQVLKLGEGLLNIKDGQTYDVTTAWNAIVEELSIKEKRDER